MSRSAGSSWSADASRYDSWFDKPWGRYASSIERECVLALAGDLAQARVADIGCGTGRLTGELERRAASVVGLDPDPSMLAVATSHTSAPMLVGDGHHLPFRDGGFDVVIAVTVCEFTADPALVVAELARITRPGGRVVLGALDPRSPWGFANRAQFGAPPWDAACFLTRADLREIGEPHGAVTVRSALYAPVALPLLERWGPILELLGRRIAPRWGAFNVMSILRPGAIPHSLPPRVHG